jgi:alcohol dehydrogenase (cytochrome c)
MRTLRHPRWMHRLLFAVLLAASLAAHAARTTPREWPLFHGTLDNQRYSSLSQITRKNVSRLQVAWVFQLHRECPPDSLLQCIPVVSDGILYCTSPKCDVFALAADTGEILWHFDPNVAIAPPRYDHIANRGVVVDHGTVYLATLDCRLFALDARTGKPMPSFGDRGQVRIGDLKEGYSETSPPTVCDGKVLIGVACGEFPTRGFFSAYDAATGKLLWRWYTTAAPDEPGGDTWPNNGSYRVGGGSQWMPAAVDRERGLVIFGTGNPNPDIDGRDRAGDNLYTCCIVALEIQTGKLRWYFQEVKHDLWDYDQASSPLLFDVVRDRKRIPAVGAAAKTGWFYVLDRETGRSLLPTREVAVPQNERHHTARTQTLLQIPPFSEHRNIFTPPTPEGVLVSPGLWGGSQWSPVSYSPQTGLAYVAAIDCPMTFRNELTETPEFEKPPAALRLGGDVAISPSSSGAFVAIDVSTGLVRWRTPTASHPVGGSTATAGGLVFTGEADGHFIALDARTGQRLWQFQCGAGVNTPPITYEVNGRQYVAVSVGGWVGNAFGFRAGDRNFYRGGSSIFVFALPQRR